MPMGCPHEATAPRRRSRILRFAELHNEREPAEGGSQVKLLPAEPGGRGNDTTSDGLDVDGLGALVALLCVVGHFRALLQRAIALAVDAGVMDEQILLAVIGGDETEPLVVAEPLYGAGRHVGNSSTVCVCCCAEDAVRASTCELCTTFAGLLCRPDIPTVAGRAG